jgi:hypothetical protein
MGSFISPPFRYITKGRTNHSTENTTDNATAPRIAAVQQRARQTTYSCAHRATSYRSGLLVEFRTGHKAGQEY